jgi:23S rRNA pseudouridine2604 synthase
VPDHAPPEIARTGSPVAARAAVADGLIRVSKLLSELGLCSRREADEYIERGWVFADGERVTQLGTRVSPTAKLRLDRGARAARARLATILLHKPVGYVSGQPEDHHPPAVALVRPENLWYGSPASPGNAHAHFEPAQLRGLAPAGRLDIESTGLLAFTQDGTVARQLVGADGEVDKEYLVRVEGQMVKGGLDLLNHGLELDDQALRPARVEWLNDDQLRVVLNEGRKRQIRRMCEHVGLRVTSLKRVRIGSVMLGDLPLGQWRYLGPDERF